MTILTPNVGEGSYALYNGWDSFSYNCISYLMTHDELIWKLLKYPTPNAWQMSDLTQEEKASLIYNGSDDTSQFHVFLDQGSPDVETVEGAIIRIAPYSLNPDNRTIGTVLMIFEAYTYFHNNHLSNYRTRNDMITKRLIQVFNGATIEGGLGKLHLDNLGSYGTRAELGGQSPWRGRWILMATKSN